MKRRYVYIAAITAFLAVITGTNRIGVTWISIQPALAFSTLDMPQPVQPNPYIAGMDALTAGDAASAASYFETALTAEPRLAHYLKTHLAEALFTTGKIDQSLSLLNEVAHSGRAVSKRALRMKLEYASTAGRPNDALAACDALLRVAAESERTTLTIRRAELFAVKGDTAAALNILTSMLEKRMGPVAAAPAVKAMLRLSPASLDLVASADVLYDGGDFHEAAALYEKILADPRHRGNSRIVMQMGRSYERSDDFRTAIGAFKRVLDLGAGPSRDLVYYRIGLCHQRLGEDNEAEKWFNRVLNEHPRSSFTDDILFRIASLRDKKEKRAEAHALYRRIIDRHPRSSWADDAAWKIGFGCLEDGKLDEAERVFAWASKKFPRSDYNSAISYWNARILEMKSDTSAALAVYTSLLKSMSQPYYRARAISGFVRLGGTFTGDDVSRARARAEKGEIVEALADLRAIRDAAAGEVRENAARAASQLFERIGYWKDLSGFSAGLFDSAALLRDLPLEKADTTLLAEINRLIELGAWDDAIAEIMAITIDAGNRPAKRLASLRLLAAAGRFREAMREAESLASSLGYSRDAVSLPPLAARFLYPRYYSPYIEKACIEYDLDANFVLAVIREESRFGSSAVSSVGARGLMQIMPATGASIARQVGAAGFSTEKLNDPETNIRFGAFYLRNLMNLYDGKKYLTLAGYNAGPGNANRWLRQYPDADEDLFVERISFKETRNYVKRVMGTYWVYSSLNAIEG